MNRNYLILALVVISVIVPGYLSAVCPCFFWQSDQKLPAYGAASALLVVGWFVLSLFIWQEHTAKRAMHILSGIDGNAADRSSIGS